MLPIYLSMMMSNCTGERTFKLVIIDIVLGTSAPEYDVVDK